MTLCLDVSQYDLSTFNPACLKAAGATDIIFGVFDPVDPPNKMRQAALEWRAVGGNVRGFYGFCYFGSPFGAYRDTKWAIQLAQEFGVDRVWVDCETDGRAVGFTDAVQPTPAQRVAEIQGCVDLIRAAGLTPGIYTGGWWWPGQTENSSQFANLPLWHSDYGANDGTREPVQEVAYGGWSKVSIHQYTSQLPVCGRNRDANYVFEEDDMGMTEAERDEFDMLKKVVCEWGEPGRLEKLNTLNVNIYQGLLNQNAALNGVIDAVHALNSPNASRGQVAQALRDAAAQLEALP